ncbi:MAG: hypothetical protein AAF442_05665 [Pseudomonadota bacterium]
MRQLISLVMILVAVVLLGTLALPWQGLGGSVGESLYQWDPTIVNRTQSIVQRYLHPALWDQALLPALLWPLRSVMLWSGVMLLLVGGLILLRRPKRRMMFARTR